MPFDTRLIILNLFYSVNSKDLLEVLLIVISISFLSILIAGGGGAKKQVDLSALQNVMGIQMRIQAAQEVRELKLKREQEAKLNKDQSAKSFLRDNKNELLGKVPDKKLDADRKKRREKQKASDCNLEFFSKPDSADTSKKETLKSKLKSPPVLGRGLKSAPMLGRGLTKDSDTLEFTLENDDFDHFDELMGDNISNSLKITHPKRTFDKEKVPEGPSVWAKQRAEKAKKNAAARVQFKGGIEAENPNIDLVKKKSKSSESVENIINKCKKSTTPTGMPKFSLFYSIKKCTLHMFFGPAHWVLCHQLRPSVCPSVCL